MPCRCGCTGHASGCELTWIGPMRFDGEADDDLNRLIRRADDDAASQLVATGDLAGRVRKRHDRRRLVRTGTASIAVAIAVVGFVSWRVLDGGQPAQQPIAAADVPPVVD